jgi:hypothetical protein
MFRRPSSVSVFSEIDSGPTKRPIAKKWRKTKLFVRILGPLPDAFRDTGTAAAIALH